LQHLSAVRRRAAFSRFRAARLGYSILSKVVEDVSQDAKDHDNDRVGVTVERFAQQCSGLAESHFGRSQSQATEETAMTNSRLIVTSAKATSRQQRRRARDLPLRRKTSELTFVPLCLSARHNLQSTPAYAGPGCSQVVPVSVSIADENAPIRASPVGGSVVAAIVAGGIRTAIAVTSSSAGSGSSGIAVSAPAAVAIGRRAVPTVARGSRTSVAVGRSGRTTFEATTTRKTRSTTARAETRTTESSVRRTSVRAAKPRRRASKTGRWATQAGRRSSKTGRWATQAGRRSSEGGRRASKTGGRPGRWAELRECASWHHCHHAEHRARGCSKKRLAKHHTSPGSGS
jgi:hypothetical protein